MSRDGIHEECLDYVWLRNAIVLFQISINQHLPFYIGHQIQKTISCIVLFMV